MGRSILLADDSKTIQKAVEMTFDKGDFDVVSVSSPGEALARCKELQPAVALLDLNFNDPADTRSGYDLCAEIRQDPSCAAVPVILLYPSMGEYDEAKGQAAGAAAHLPKPFESQAMIDAVKGLADGGGAAAEAIAPEPITPEPIAPEPIAPEPIAPEPEPEAIAPEPIAPEPIAPEPIAPEPIAPEPEFEAIAPEPPAPEAELEPIAEIEPIGDDADLPEAELEPIAPEPDELPEAELEPIAPEPEAVLAPEPFETPEATLTPEPLETPEAALTPEPLETPEAVLTPEPLETPEPMSLDEAPEALLTPEPIETPEPETFPEADLEPITPEPVETPAPIETPEAPPEAILTPDPFGDEEDLTPALDAGAPDAMELEPVAPSEPAPVDAPLTPPPMEVPEVEGVMELEPVAPPTEGGATAAAPVVDRVVTAAAARVAPSGDVAQTQQALGALIYEVIERVAWEVVPDLAEAIIREELDRLIQAKKQGEG